MIKERITAMKKIGILLTLQKFLTQAFQLTKVKGSKHHLKNLSKLLTAFNLVNETFFIVLTMAH